MEFLGYRFLTLKLLIKPMETLTFSLLHIFFLYLEILRNNHQ